MLNLMELMKDLGDALTTPITITGRPLTAEELRRKRASKAKNRILGLNGSLDMSTETSSFVLNGMIEEGSDFAFAIDGQEFIISEATWIAGIVMPGSIAVVKGIVERDGKRYARSIVVANKM